MDLINACVCGSCGRLKSTSLCGVLGGGFVERRFFCTQSIWPFDVATDAGRYLLTFLDVTPGQVVN